MTCKNCGSSNIERQGFVIVGPDRQEDWASGFLDDKMYTCLDCKDTFIYRGVEKWLGGEIATSVSTVEI